MLCRSHYLRDRSKVTVGVNRQTSPPGVARQFPKILLCCVTNVTSRDKANARRCETRPYPSLSRWTKENDFRHYRCLASNTDNVPNASLS
jgi:hypothetical protein